MLPTLQLTRAALRRWFTWNCSPSYARITSSLARLFVAFAGTKHCCLTAVNRDGALCCPDFPRDRGLKPKVFLPLSRDEPAHYLYFMFALLTLPKSQLRFLCDKRIATKSGIRESNPPPRLGKPMHYRCANAAN